MTTTDVPTPPDAYIEPFHLKTTIELEGEFDPTLPMMWCVEPETKQQLIDEGIAQPFFLISVIHVDEHYGDKTYTEMDRYIVQLTQMMEFPRFSRPGQNVVKATIVWTSQDHAERVMRRVAKSRKQNGEYTVNVLDYDGNFRDQFVMHRGKNQDDYCVQRHAHVTEFSFIVPADGFGKASPQFEKDYFGKFFQFRPVDECKRRQRRLFLWPLFPVFLIWVSFVKLIAFTGFQLVGYRKATIKPLIHPIKQDIEGVWANVNQGYNRDPIRWFQNNKGNWWPLPVVIFNPFTILAGWGILAFLANLTYGHKKSSHYGQHYLFSMRWYQSLLWSVGIHAAVALAVLLVLIIITVCAVIYGWLLPPNKREQHSWEKKREAQRKKQATEQKRKEAQAQRNARLLQQLESGLGTMSCDRLPTKVTFTSLPRERQTIHLRFQDVKRRVCRPFAR